jgi:hypothetical protein
VAIVEDPKRGHLLSVCLFSPPRAQLFKQDIVHTLFAGGLDRTSTPGQKSIIS